MAFSRLTCQKRGLKEKFELVLGPAFVWWCVVVGWWWWWCTVRAVGGNRGMLREIYRANLRLRKYNHIIMHAQNKKTFHDRNGEIKLVPPT